MNDNMTIRPVTADDIAPLKQLIDAVGLFPSELLDSMLAGYLAGNAENELWLTAHRGRARLAIAYAAREKMTTGTSNLYLIAIHPSEQAKGVGTALLAEIESSLTSDGQRILLVETSGLAEFHSARSFYMKRGFAKEACIRDFYDEGEDKIVFWKRLLLSQ